MNTVLKAGVIIVRDGLNEPEILLLFRGKHNDWSFPKGHCEANESFEETALREAREETGLSVTLLKQLPNMEYIDGLAQRATVGMYLGTRVDGHEKERIEHETDRLAWIPLSKVEAMLSYQNLRDYFLQIRPIIQDASASL